MGADFPYMCMVCGEPRGVWRRSAPLMYYKQNKKTYENVKSGHIMVVYCWSDKLHISIFISNYRFLLLFVCCLCNCVCFIFRYSTF